MLPFKAHNWSGSWIKASFLPAELSFEWVVLKQHQVILKPICSKKGMMTFGNTALESIFFFYQFPVASSPQSPACENMKTEGKKDGMSNLPEALVFCGAPLLCPLSPQEGWVYGRDHV